MDPAPSVAYEDYQRDIRRFREKQEQGPPLLERRFQSSPDLGVEDRAGLRSSDITHIGGFRREFLHRQSTAGGPGGLEGAGADRSSLAPASSLVADTSRRRLATQIDDHMRSLVLFFGCEDNCYEADDGGGLFEDATTQELRASGLSGQAGRHHKLSVARSCLSTFKAFIGTAILFMPQAMTNAGWAAAVLLMTASAAVSTVGILMLGQCHNVVPRSYPEIGREALGTKGYALISFQLAVSQFCFATCGIVFIDNTVKQICTGYGLGVPPSWATVTAVVVVSMPLGWIRRIGKMKVSHLLGDVIIVLAVLFVLGAAGVRLSSVGVSQSVVAFARPSRVARFVGTSVYSFEGIALVIPIRESMQRPDKFPHVLGGMMALFTTLLTGFGVAGYSAWGEPVETVVLNELPQGSGTVMQGLYIIAVITTFPLVIFPTFSICEGQLFSAMPPSTRRKMLKNLFRNLVTVFMGIVAYFMSSSLSMFVSLIGSFCCIPLAIVLPALLHMQLVGTSRYVNLLMVVVGTVLIPLTLFIDIMFWGQV